MGGALGVGLGGWCDDEPLTEEKGDLFVKAQNAE